MKKWIGLVLVILLVSGCIGGSGSKKPVALTDVVIDIVASGQDIPSIDRVNLYWRSGVDQKVQTEQKTTLPAAFELKDLMVGNLYQYWVRVEGSNRLLWQTDPIEFDVVTDGALDSVVFPRDHVENLAVGDVLVQMAANSEPVVASALRHSSFNEAMSDWTAAGDSQREGIVPDQISVLLEPDMSIEDLKQAGYNVIQYWPSLHRAIVEQPVAGVRALSSAGILQSDPVFIYQTMADPVIPNDPKYGDQWSLPQIGMPEAWTHGTGSSEIRVAILDTPIDTTHPDLRGRFDINAGADFSDRSTTTGSSLASHGTHVAGILAAQGNNGIGVAGMDWNATMIAIAVLDARGIGSTESVTHGLLYAAGLEPDSEGNWISQPADVINMSLGAPGVKGDEDNAFREVVSRVAAEGILMIAAAGNTGSQTELSWPARLEEIVGVGSSDEDDRVSFFSPSGPGLDLLAPGEQILSTVNGGSYALEKGTSMATPHVTGAVSLLLAQGVPADQVLWYLKETAKPVAVNGSSVGRLQVDQAIKASLPNAVELRLQSLDDPQRDALKAYVARDNGSQHFFDRLPGRYRLTAWMDMDSSGDKSAGDYYFEDEILVWPGERLTIEVDLERIRDR